VIWCEEDSQDVTVAVAELRRVAALLEADVKRRSPGSRTREAVDAAVRALLDLRDVYYADKKAPRPEGRGA
jgi:hypothetical protein